MKLISTWYIKSFMDLDRVSAESWIKKLKQKNDGREDFKALVAHYSGEGNTNHCLSTVDNLRDMLHYKSE
jgi:hypothetical protein